MEGPSHLGYGLQLKLNHVKRGCRTNHNPCPWPPCWAQCTGTMAELQPLTFSIQQLEKCNKSSELTTVVTSQKTVLQLLYTAHNLGHTQGNNLSHLATLHNIANIQLYRDNESSKYVFQKNCISIKLSLASADSSVS